MRAIIKPLLWLFSGIFTILLLLWVALLTVDVDNYRTPLQRHVSAAFGREVVFAGALSLEPSPTPRLVIEGLKIGNPDWASRPFLALVDRFAVKLSLLPLLQGELKILALEFHGVDLKLEQGPAGANNYTFGTGGQPSLLPVIEHLELYEVDIAWLPERGVARSHHLQQLSARKVPRQPVEMTLKTTVNGLPLRLSLHGVPGGDSWPFGPWDTTLQGTLGDLSLRLTGTVPRPDEWYRGSYRFELQGDALHKLEPLLGVDLPEPGYRPADYHLEGLVQFNLNDYLVISEISGETAGSEFSGELRWELSALEARAIGWRQLLEVGEFALRAQGSGPLWQQQYRVAGELTQLAVHEIEVAAQPQQPLLLTARASFGDTALTVNLQAEPLGKLAEHSHGPWQNMSLDVRGEGIRVSVSGSVARPLEAGGFDISYALEGAEFATLLGQSGEFALSGRYRDQPDRHLLDELSARIGETELSGRVVFHIPADQGQRQEESPAGQPPETGYSRWPDQQEWLRRAEIDLVVQPPAAIAKQEFSIAGRTFRVEISPIRASALPGQALHLSAVASINEKPVQL
ncbi:MAG: AsmA family protein, partial [Gammaproteobacteria bacterium]|nr:AsmA family protein [Gammaproteobacteria bacterium]